MFKRKKQTRREKISTLVGALFAKAFLKPRRKR